ncbi:MAG: dihydroflavonol-4-reductase [Limisphaerales bacterium]|jgi:dihydroflavonol-4-reductase
MFFNPQRAIDELGLPQTPAREALGEAVDWFKSHGFVRSH